MEKTLPKGYMRTPPERERDLVELARLRLRGFGISDAVLDINNRRKYTYSRGMGYNDDKELLKRWRESQLIDVDEAKARELALIEKMIDELWKAWERSLEESDMTVEENVDDQWAGENSQAYQRIKKVTKRSKRDGSVAFMQEIGRLIDKRISILGLAEAKKSQININWREEIVAAGADEATASEIFEQMVEQAVDAIQSGKQKPFGGDGE